MKFAAAVMFLGLSVACAGAVPGSARPPSEPQHYRLCLAMSSSNPAGALGDAQVWAREGGGVPAQHCAALAMVGLRRYAEAGAALDKLAADKAVPDAGFRSELFDQAGNAWLLAGNAANAVRSFSAALTLSAGDADLYADLARAQAMRKNWHEVDLDLNAALRASARRALKRYDDARNDIEAALTLKPGDGGALVERGLLRRQLGDLGGAKRDFQAALKTGAAAEAQDNLNQLAP